MNRLLEIAQQFGTLPEGFAPATGETAQNVAEDANEAIFAWAAALARMRTPRGYMRPEHAFAVAYALGSFYLVSACGEACDFDAFQACQGTFMSRLSIDQAQEDAAELMLYTDLTHRAADIALHGRQPGPELVKRLMAHSLTGLMELDDNTPEKTAVLATLETAIRAIDAAGQDD